MKMKTGLIRHLAWAGCLLFLSAASAVALEVQPVAEGVYALVGEKEQRSPGNLANNATFGVVVTNEGVVLVETWVDYQPLVTYLVQPFQIYHAVATRPRFAPTLAWAD